MAIESVRFEVVPDWEQCPPGDEYSHEDVAAVACDSQDRVYLHTRRGDRVSVYREDGAFLDKWGDGLFKIAHGITIADDLVYCTDNGDSVIRIFDLEGNLKKMLGTPGVVSDTGYGFKGPARIHHNETVERSAGPFNSCCNTAIARPRPPFLN
jgi:hypothetical protein